MIPPMLCAVNRRFVYLLVLTASSLAGSQEFKLPDTPQLLHRAPGPSDRFPAKWYTRTGDGTDVIPAPVLDRPYEATVETMTPDQSPSGKPLPRFEYGFQARDRFGRTRSETHNGQMGVGEHVVPTEVVIVSDPVSHCDFDWIQPMTGDVMLPGTRTAEVFCRPQTLRYQDWNLAEDILATIVDGITTSGDTITQTEHLAPLQIDGLAVTRLRVTNNSHTEKGDMKRWSAETWYSPDLKEIIRMSDEESGYRALTDIRRDDPDPKLFYPPQGYEIMLRAPR
jgi:hypothetical protein